MMQQFVDAIYDFGRQFSFALENVQLLEEVLQQRRLLEDTFNSFIDLVVVTDNGSRVVQMNDAFAARVGSPRRAVIDRPLSELVSPEIAQWVSASEPGARGGEPHGGITGRRDRCACDSLPTTGSGASSPQR